MSRHRVNTAMAVFGAALLWAAPIGAAEPAKVVGPGCRITSAENNRAVAAFQKMLPVLQHPRCANCHGKIDVFSAEAEQTHGVEIGAGTQKIGEKTGFGKFENSFKGCQDCHTRALDLVRKEKKLAASAAVPFEIHGMSGHWQQPDSGSRYFWGKLAPEQMCRAMKDPFRTGEDMMEHVRHDVLIGMGFEGRRAQDDLQPLPPVAGNPPRPISRDEFVSAFKEWMDAMHARDGRGGGDWPESPDCGCVKVPNPEEDAAAACKSIPNSSFAGYQDGKPQCACVAGMFFNKARTACLTKEDREREGKANCAKKYPNSVFTWNRENQPKCVCPKGMTWNRADNACITEQARAEEESAVCGRSYPNSTFVGYKDGKPQCGCSPGMQWSADGRACLTKEARAREGSAACAASYPNSVLTAWDRTGKPKCGCAQGWEWNRERTACARRQVAAAPPPKRMPSPASKQPASKGKSSDRDACIQCVNKLITGSCYVRIPKLAGWGLCLSCVPDGGVEPNDRFIDRDRCPVCKDAGWKLEDFKAYKYN